MFLLSDDLDGRLTAAVADHGSHGKHGDHGDQRPFTQGGNGCNNNDIGVLRTVDTANTVGGVRCCDGRSNAVALCVELYVFKENPGAALGVKDVETNQRAGSTGDGDLTARVGADGDIVQGVDVGNEQLIVTLRGVEDDYSVLATMLIEAGFPIRLFREEEVNLESAFMALTKGVGAKI